MTVVDGDEAVHDTAQANRRGILFDFADDIRNTFYKCLPDDFRILLVPAWFRVG